MIERAFPDGRITSAVIIRFLNRQHALLRRLMRAYFDGITRGNQREIQLFEAARQHAPLSQHETFAEASRANIHKLMAQLHGAHAAVDPQGFDRFDTRLELASDDPHLVQQALALNRASLPR